MTRPRPLVPRGDPADTVKVVGEFGVIGRVLAQAGTARAAQVGPGDDAAVLRAPDRRGVAAPPRPAGGGDVRPGRGPGGGTGATRGKGENTSVIPPHPNIALR